MTDAPLEPRRPIGVLGATLVLGGFVLGLQLALLGMVRLLSLVSGIPLAEAGTLVVEQPIFGALAALLATFVVTWLARRRYLPGRRFTEEFGLRPTPWSILGFAAIAGVALHFPFTELGNLVEELAPLPFELEERLARMLDPPTFVDGLGLVFSVVAIAPVTEELVFRGLLLPGIARGSGTGVAVVISTLGFALSHQLPALVVVAFAGGLVLAFLTIRARSIVPSIVFHAAFNAVPVLLPMRVVALEGLNVPAREATHLPLGLVLGGLAVGAIALVALARQADRSDD